MKKGDLIESILYLGGGADIAALEIPIYIDNNKFDIESLETLNGFNPDYYYNTDNNRLTILYLYDGRSTLDVSNSEVLNIKLRAKQNIEDISSAYQWDTSRDIQLLNKDIEYSDAYVELRINRIIPSILSLKVLATPENTFIRVASDKDLNNSLITISNIQGQVLHQKQVDITSGYSEFTFPLLPQNGMYITTLKSGDKVISEKFMVINN